MVEHLNTALKRPQIALKRQICLFKAIFFANYKKNLTFVFLIRDFLKIQYILYSKITIFIFHLPAIN
jgi:hypothetical protein